MDVRMWRAKACNTMKGYAASGPAVDSISVNGPSISRRCGRTGSVSGELSLAYRSD